jgi:putative ABC transport system permease protein
VNDLPFRGVARTERVRAAIDRSATPGTERAGERRRFRADVRAVRGAYFAALGVPLVRGSWFDDTETDRRVTVLNETLAGRLFGDSDPIGRRVVIDDRGWEVIGVVGDTRSRSLGQRPRGEAYVPGARESHRSAAILLRTAAPPHTVVPAVRAAVRRIDPALALADIATMAQRIETSIAPQRFHAALLGGLSVLALLLAATGIYGLVAYSVSQRNREIGIRLALGEDARTVRRRVLLPVLGLAVTGCIAGALLAVATSEWFDDVMEEVAADPGVIAGVPVLLLAVALAAAWGPARRASRVDPMIAIRE